MTAVLSPDPSATSPALGAAPTLTGALASQGAGAEVAALRKRDVDAAVNRFINLHDGDVTIEQINKSEADALRKWRERWPALNGLLYPATEDRQVER